MAQLLSFACFSVFLRTKMSRSGGMIDTELPKSFVCADSAYLQTHVTMYWPAKKINGLMNDI